MARKGLVEFKGNLNGLYLNVDEHEKFDKIFVFLETLLTDKSAFYRGSKIIGLIGQQFSYKQKAQIESLLSDVYDIQVESLEPYIETKKSIKTDEEKVEIAPQIEVTPVEQPKVEKTPKLQKADVPDTHYVFGTMRSGKSVHYAGNIVVIGDVNPGAEIIAEGNVFVFGRLLGFVHAGSAGNEKSMIVANVLKPTQIRIAKHISVPPSDDHSIHTVLPEIALVHEGIIKIEKYH